MEYRHVHYLQFEPDIEQKAILNAAVTLSNQKNKENFLLKAASFICRHTKVEYVGIGLLTEQNTAIRTCTLLQRDKVLDNITYSVKGTPCEDVFIHRFCYYPTGVSKLFPEDKIVQKLGIESYLGTILVSQENEAIGVVEIMDIKTIRNPGFAEHLILVLCPSIEEELQK